MNKKTIMLGIYVMNLILFLVFSVLSFSMYSIDAVETGQTILNVKWTQKLENDAYIDALYAVADEISSDFMIRTLNEEMQFQYFRTERDPDFLSLEGLQPDLHYSTKPKNGEQKIRGFFFLTDSDFEIAPLRELKGSPKDLSMQQFLVPKAKADALSDALTAHGLTVSSERGISLSLDFSFLYLAMAALGFFLIVSVVFYAFSRAKDMFVKKTMGFGNFDIVLVEMKENAIALLLVTLALMAAAFVLFSALADVASTLFFLQKNLLKILLYLLGTFLLMVIFVFFVSTQCSISSSKGKSFNRQLFTFTVVFKTVLIVFLGVAMGNLFDTIGKVYSLYRNTKQTADLVAGYATTEENVLLEDPMQIPEKYAPLLHSFYHEMHDSHHLIIMSRQQVIFDYSVNETRSNQYHITVNDNYLDTFDTITAPDGTPIHADALTAGKINYLVPQGFDTAAYVKKMTAKGKYTADDFCFIFYADSSRFFLFTNKVENGFLGDSKIIAEVFDEAECYQNESVMTYTAMMGGYLSNSMFYTYDTASEQDPYYQILPIITETGLDKIVISSPSVYRDFLEDVRMYRNEMIYTSLQFLMLLFAFIVMIVYATELNFKVYAKDISVKTMNGYSFGDIFAVRMLLKLLVFPLLILVGKVRLIIAVCCLAAEIVIFIICMKKNLRKNTVSILKGE